MLVGHLLQHPILGAFAGVRTLASVTDVSVFALNIITLLGLGLAIDYALFVVTRFREELARGADVEAAVVATVATAGRTIVWSGLTVALSRSGQFAWDAFRDRLIARIAEDVARPYWTSWAVAFEDVLDASTAVEPAEVDARHRTFLNRRPGDDPR